MNKTIFLFSSAFSRVTGGIPNTAFYMYEHFSNAGNNVIAIAASKDNEESLVGKIFEASGNNIAKFLHNTRLYKDLAAKSTDNQSVAISLSWRYAIVPYFNRKYTKIPYIVMCHGNDVLPYGKGLRSKFEAVLRDKIINNASYVCVNSEYTRDLVKKIIHTNRIRIIHPCSGEAVKRGQPNNSKMSKSPVILSIGRLEERKGFQYIVDALKQLVSKYPDIQYLIAGDGPYRERLAERIKTLELEDRCKFLGRVSEEEKQELFDQCTVLVMPSFHDVGQRSVEGFGIVFIEANAHGKPSIGTDSGGIRDAIIEGKTGYIVPEKDVTKLAEAIDLSISTEATIDKEFCYQWAEKHYYSNLLNEYLSLFDEVIGSAK